MELSTITNNKYKVTVKKLDSSMIVNEMTITAKSVEQVENMLKGIANAVVFISEIKPGYRVGNVVYNNKEEAEFIAEISETSLIKVGILESKKVIRL